MSRAGSVGDGFDGELLDLPIGQGAQDDLQPPTGKIDLVDLRRHAAAKPVAEPLEAGRFAQRREAVGEVAEGLRAEIGVRIGGQLRTVNPALAQIVEDRAGDAGLIGLGEKDGFDAVRQTTGR